MKLIIAGARDLFLTNQLIGFFVSGFRLKPSMVLSGASGFVDKAGEYWATAEGIPVKRFVADWEAQGRAAGPIRNVEMAELGDVLLLIWRGDSPGSASMKREMEKLKKPVYEVIFKTPVEKEMTPSGASGSAYRLKNWEWPYSGRGELSCPHNIGHGGIHGCDGCCSHKSFNKAWKRKLKKGEWRKK